MLVDWLRKLDYEAAQRVDYFIANSRTTQERIQQYYNRESEVIYPGVSVPRHPDEGRIQDGKLAETLDSSQAQNDRNKESYYL
jgi:hypothetical protein